MHKANTEKYKANKERDINKMGQSLNKEYILQANIDIPLLIEKFLGKCEIYQKLFILKINILTKLFENNLFFNIKLN